MAGPLEQSMTAKLKLHFEPTLLQITNDSHLHAHHTAMKGSTSRETHFTVHLTSANFTGKRMMERHRSVYKVLSEEFQNGLHALALKTKSPEEDVV